MAERINVTYHGLHDRIERRISHLVYGFLPLTGLSLESGAGNPCPKYVRISKINRE